MAKKLTADEWHAETLRAYVAADRGPALHPLSPVIIGQAGPSPKPGRRGSPMFPNPRNSAGYRLFAMTGFELDEYLATFERFNTLPHFPGHSGRGHKFPAKEAREFAERHMAERRLTERPCIIIGKANAKHYFGTELPEPLTWSRVCLADWAWMPHTSGIVQFWNQAGNKEKVAELFADLKDYVPGDNA